MRTVRRLIIIAVLALLALAAGPISHAIAGPPGPGPLPKVVQSAAMQAYGTQWERYS